MVDQRAHVVYRRLLLGLGHGYPLWIPEPDQSLPAEYRCRGVSVGDVGLMTEDGGFDFLYNVHRAAGDPINGGRVPPDFHPLPLLDEELPIRILPFMHKTKSIITSQHVVKRSLTVEASAELAVFAGGGFGFEYSTTKAEAALLVLPDGATRYMARNRSVYMKYAKENGVAIYQYVNGTLGREVPNGSVYIVTGCDKCQSWGNAALSQPEDRQGVSLKFIAGGLAGGGLAVHSACDSDFGMETRCYPPVQGYATTDDENQCVFTKGIVIAVRESFLMSKVLGPVQLVHISGSPKDNHWNPYPSGSSWSPYSSSSGSGSTSSSSASYRGQTRSIGISTATFETSDDIAALDEKMADSLKLGLEVDIGEFPEYPAAVLNPSSYIGKRVLSMCPTADAVVVDDEIWTGALRPSEEENNVVAVVQKLLEHIVVEEVDGIATLIAPEAPQEERSGAEQTEAVDQPSQISNDESNLWGILVPCNQNLLPIKFDRRKPLYKIGRNDALNDVLFPGGNVSNEHAEIRWNGIDGDQSRVVVRDKSSNGTFINRTKIGKGKSSDLHEDDKIAFGNVSPQPPESMEDYRFIFHSFTSSTPNTGLLAEYDLTRELGTPINTPTIHDFL